MKKPMIILEKEMRQELAEVTNKYINQLPAAMIAVFFSRLTEQFERLAEQQYEQALAQYNKEESEVNADGREETNN